MHSLARRNAGFTWIELLMVLAVLAILGAMAIPSMQDATIKKQVREALALADVAKKGVQAAWNAAGEMPADNAAAGAPPREKIVGNFVRGVAVVDGAVTLTLGNNAAKPIDGKRVTLRPAVMPGEAAVPIAWICHAVTVPAGMEVLGRDETDIPPKWLPVECRGNAKE